MRYINLRFTYLLTYLLTYYVPQPWRQIDAYGPHCVRWLATSDAL